MGTPLRDLFSKTRHVGKVDQKRRLIVVPVSPIPALPLAIHPLAHNFVEDQSLSNLDPATFPRLLPETPCLPSSH